MSKEAMKLALEALTNNSDRVTEIRMKADAIKALEEALAKQEPDDLMIAYMSGLHDGKKLAKQEQGEPVAWIDNSGHPKHMSHVQSVSERKLYGARRPLYEAPQQRTWVGLTESDRRLINFQWQDGNGTATEIIDLVEAKLKEKNT